MGARLVSHALMRWSHVSDRAFRVLVRMALTALDEPSNDTPARIYFGGRELLAMTLRNERDGDREAAYRTVRRAIAELIAVGAIERTNNARSGQNQVYLLRVDTAGRIDSEHVDNPGQGDTSGPPEGDTSGPPEGDTRSPFRGTPADPPRNQEEPVEELYEERKPDLRTAVTGPRAGEAAKDPNLIGCPKCIRGYSLNGDQLDRCGHCWPENVIPIRPVA